MSLETVFLSLSCLCQSPPGRHTCDITGSASIPPGRANRMVLLYVCWSGQNKLLTGGWEGEGGAGRGVGGGGGQGSKRNVRPGGRILKYILCLLDIARLFVFLAIFFISTEWV